MEAGQIEVDGCVGITTGTPYTPPAQEEHFDSPKLDPSRASSTKMKKVKSTNQESQEKDTPPSVSNCYVFKSRLQEYCQKAGLSTPVYETIKEGPSHEPSFKSNVTVNNVRYDSLPGFFNRKAAEQSAAEVALIELAKINNMNFGITQPVHETGLCKNLLQEYAQKMNYAIPLYECRKEEKEGRMPMYSCVVEIGGIKYIGASASTKKEAEIKAARTALLAIQTAVPISEDHTGNSVFTVIPHKKKLSDLAISSQETKTSLKPKKGRFKKQFRKKRRPAKRDDSTGGTAHLEVNTDGHVGVGLTATDTASSEPNTTASFRVDMVGQGGMEVHAVDTVDSHGKTNGGSNISEDGQRQESSVTSVVSSHGVVGKSGANACSTYDGHLENVGVPFEVMDVN
ncbi:dsRNA-binding domain-like superfamily protein [Perilla frutescens var. hirtella]|nr:dsRNA-binding domain-like superfamily protein [Perilla frutescens var. frutescens]KAH6793655.1 dsRNA-binding domain-like superfamily protein [Perilla frutescens var. hirtella]